MTDFSRKPDLLSEVRDAGEQYLSSARVERTDYSLTEVSDFTFNKLHMNERLRKLGQFVISDMTLVSPRKVDIEAMDNPVFTWNNSLRDPIIHSAENTLLNSSDCFPPSLTVLAMDYVDQGYGKGDTVYDLFVQKVGALFYNEATPRDFQIDASRRGVGLHFADSQSSPISEVGHVASGRLLYSLIQKGDLPAFDIHDITHHASQMSLYGDFYKWLASQASDEIMTNKEAIRYRRLIRTVLLTSIEHSIVASEDMAQSFGCLNWQAPRKSILSLGVSKRDTFRVNDYAFGAQDINRWSAVRAIASIYREQLEAEKLVGESLDWMHAMGYDMDKELLERIEPFQSYDYSDMAFDTARHVHITTPATPEELFDNCRKLVTRELFDNE